MTLIREGHMSYLDSFVLQYVDHHLSLIGGYDLIFKTLQKNDWAVEPLSMVDG